jgi:hypothetical protein
MVGSIKGGARPMNWVWWLVLWTLAGLAVAILIGKSNND